MERRTSLNEITERVKEIVAASNVSRQVKKVALVPDLDGDEDEFLRVELTIAMPAQAHIEDLQILSKAIQDAVDEVDERFASVRFPDAA